MFFKCTFTSNPTHSASKWSWLTFQTRPDQTRLIWLIKLIIKKINTESALNCIELLPIDFQTYNHWLHVVVVVVLYNINRCCPLFSCVSLFHCWSNKSLQRARVVARIQKRSPLHVELHSPDQFLLLGNTIMCIVRWRSLSEVGWNITNLDIQRENCYLRYRT